ncbi:DNA-directed RNA polymerase V subunit 5A-like isoform X1 [Tasmannia lanceolata]|uniref:DNA-directed RNA polymerase V subunit 5A-like isoform X1 n=1 Tax=Tasmannia lanceolata TaxID=3420 RepID=UPI004062DF02
MMMEEGSCINSFIDTGSLESHRYFRARRTVFEMLRDRGYDVRDSEFDLTLPQFRLNYGENPDLERLRISTSLLSDPSKKILVIFCGTDAVKLPIIRGIYTQVKEVNLNRMILIVQSKMTPQAKQAIAEIFPFKVELFQIQDLLINITKHVLMPEHYMLTPEEKEKLLKQYSVEDKQLPRILETDAIARYYGLEKGQVVKVTYGGEITGDHVTFRCVT